MAIGLYTDYSRNSRFFNTEIDRAVNDAIMKKIDSITDSDKPNELRGIDRIQKFRDELFTLVKTAALTVTNIGAYNDDVYINHANYPTDYQTYVSITTTISGTSTYCRDQMTHNTKGPILECSFLKPSNKKPYMLEDATGFNIYKGTSATMTANLEYIKVPATFTMGADTDLINAGAGVLAINTTYIAVDVSVYNAITYREGVEFTTNGALTDLTSGQVIKKSLTTAIELPPKCHEEIAKMAAEILLGVNSDYDGSQFAEKESK
jgi:hypothetical protein